MLGTAQNLRNPKQPGHGRAGAEALRASVGDTSVNILSNLVIIRSLPQYPSISVSSYSVVRFLGIGLCWDWYLYPLGSMRECFVLMCNYC